MALSTQCPHCKTVFRVASDQLKLRSGLVRCGSCKQIFNGIENLVPDGTVPQTKPPAAAPSVAAPSIAASAAASAPSAPAVPVTPSAAPAAQPAPVVSSPGIDFVSMEPEPAAATSESARSATAASPVAAPAAQPATDEEEDPLLRMTVMNIVPEEEDASAEEPSPAAEELADQDDKASSASTVEDASEKVDEKPVESISDEPVKSALLAPAHAEPEENDTAPAGFEEEDAEEEEKLADEKEVEEKESEPETKAPAPLRRTQQITDDEETEEDEAYEPSFVTHARKRQRRGKILRIFMSITSVILLAGLLAQGAYVFRTQLAARFPQTKPMLAQLCQFAGCQVKLPAQIDMVSIESTELQAATPNKNVFTLNVLLRNRSTLAQAWPDIELTLNDGNEQAVARRVLLPRDYLPAGQDTVKGFSANSEQPIKVVFELAQIKASGYRVYLFYP